MNEIRDLCVQLQKMRDRMPCRGSAVTMVSTLLEQCKVSSKPQMITVGDVKRADSHSNGSPEIFQPKKAPHSTDDIQHMKTCSKNDIDVNGTRNICEQMRSHLNQVNRNATCPTHICTTADVCDVRGVGNEMPVHSSDCHNELQQLSQQMKNPQSLQNVSMENASTNERQPSSSSSSSKNTKQDLDFSNLKLRCMCSEVDKFHSCVKADVTAVTEINDSENATAFNAPCIQFHRCDTSDCVKECYFIQRCCFCRRQSNYNSDANSGGQASASANNKSLNVHNHGAAEAIGDSVHISQHSHSCSGGNNLNLTLSTRKSDKICRCESEHCHNNQSYCDDGARKNTCHCMRMCDFDLDRIDNEREELSVHTVIFASDANVSPSLANASPPDRIRIKCDKSLVATTGHPFTDREADSLAISNAETAPTTTDAENSACHSATIAVADDTSNVINNLTNEKRNKTTEKLVLDLNDRSKYTKEVSV